MANRYTPAKLDEIEHLHAGLLENDPANISAGEVKGLLSRIRALEAAPSSHVLAGEVQMRDTGRPYDHQAPAVVWLGGVVPPVGTAIYKPI